jgi:hypothetical protein
MHLNIYIYILILNNRSYKILKLNHGNWSGKLHVKTFYFMNINNQVTIFNGLIT